MGAGGSVPSTVEAAKAQGFTDEQIRMYLEDNPVQSVNNRIVSVIFLDVDGATASILLE